MAEQSREFFLMDLERTIKNGVPAYWKGNKRGYTYKVEHAGIFQELTAREIAKRDRNESTILIPRKLMQKYLEEIKVHESNN
jgi:hypothetical protein